MGTVKGMLTEQSKQGPGLEERGNRKMRKKKRIEKRKQITHRDPIRERVGRGRRSRR